jgi:phage recombination protein Bet
MNLDDEIDLYLRNLKMTDHAGDKLTPPTKGDVDSFRVICHRTGLSPITRQIYLVPRPDRKTGKTSWTPQTSIDGFRAIADRAEGYKGQAGPFWHSGEKDADWTDVPMDAPYAAKVGVYKGDNPNPTWAVARFDDYQAPGPMWKKFGPTMIAKCAEALALRKTFPAAMAGLYTSEEMAQAAKEEKSLGGGKTPKATKSDPQLEEAKAAIAAAKSVDELKEVGKTLLSKLPPGSAQAISAEYQERLGALQ